MPPSTIAKPIDERQQSPAAVVSSQQAIDSRDLEVEASNACAALELVACLVETASFDAACVTVVNRLKAFLNADGVALGLIRAGGRNCRLTAIAGAADVN